MTLPTCHCGAPAFAIRPGTDAETTDLFDAPLTRGDPDEAWCREHWVRRFARSAEQPALP